MAIDPGSTLQIDEAYEFCAPTFFDFMNEETEVEIQRAERWFETSLSYAPSPFVPKIKLERSVQIGLCNFESVEETQKAPGIKPHEDTCPSRVDTSSSMANDKSSFEFPVYDDNMTPSTEACTPKVMMATAKGNKTSKNQTACSGNKTSSLIRQPSALKPKNQLNSVQSAKGIKPNSTTRCPGSTTARKVDADTAKKTMGADFAQENQAIKKQKLDSGRARQILNVKSRALPHKSKPRLTRDSDLFTTCAKQNQAVLPFVSTAEMVRKFESRTREIELSHNRSWSHDDTASVIRRRPKLTLTRPKEPEFETTQRVRAVRVKSSAELEEEMLAKIPKFKARPVNKKILEGPTLPALPRSAPQPPEFQEFNLKTMERAAQHAESSSTKDPLQQDLNKPLHLTEPRPPLLETALRARPPRIKSSQEVELEELEKVPKFKARPLNKKILESRGDLGLFCNPKPQVTTPQEFHFATDGRMGPPASVMEFFDKLSLHSEPSQDQREFPRITIPNPFHLHTEERGIVKEKQFVEQILKKQLEEEKARIPRANPYPYTTDYPVMPPKPEPKQCTKLEAFQLESLVKHEEEMQRIFEEKQRMEKEEAQRRIFKAQPVMRDDPSPLPERERRALTEVQGFVLHVDDRAVHRSEFDKKIKEKETMYKRLREENETAKMVEEEKAVKQMRREMVPHARPVPKFDNPFLPQKSLKEITKSKSPNLRLKQREGRRPASHLR